MRCPDCGQKMEISRTVPTLKRVIRTHECPCGSAFETEESISGRLRSPATGSTPVHTRGSPVITANPSVHTGSAGGVGGDLPSGIGTDRSAVRIDPGPISSPEASGVPIGRDRPPRAARRPVLAAATIPFLEVFDRYPRKYGKARAAQVWQELAETHSGGEAALSKDILAAFDRGLLAHPPYSGEEQHQPMLETFLADRAWEDPVGTASNGKPDAGWPHMRNRT